MPAIPKHKTDTVDDPWDGPEMETRVKSGEDYDYYKQIYAWRHPDGDPSVKATYKFIHHMVSKDGTPGAANIRACITGIAVLNGARGGTNIPKGDYQGVYEHLASHLKDADVEPPDLKRSMDMPFKEVRMLDILIPSNDEAVEENGEMIVEGYAIRFNEPAVFIVGGIEYREIIVPEALAKTDLNDVPLKYNHSDDIMIMARTRNKTLQLIKDEQGLKIRAKLANTTAGRDLYELIKRGDIDKMSFAFTVRKDSYDKETRTRTILDIAKIWDVSAVVQPAYETTSIYARSYFEFEREKELEALERAIRRKKLKIKTYL